MTSDTKPEIVRGPIRHTEGSRTRDVWYAVCPGCGLEAMIDGDQYAGRVSIDCPECPYHETHDLR